jgi:hypothetical protein
VHVEYPSAALREARNARSNRVWLWAMCLPLALSPAAFLIPRHTPPPLVNLREEAGQLRISWTTPTNSTLTILDGKDRRFIAITPTDSTVIYARRSGDVTVQLGSALARFVGPPPPPSEIEQLRTSVKSLQEKITSLRNARAAGWWKIAVLEGY